MCISMYTVVYVHIHVHCISILFVFWEGPLLKILRAKSEFNFISCHFIRHWPFPMPLSSVAGAPCGFCTHEKETLEL